MSVCFVDIGGIVDHHCLIFLSIKEKEKDLPNQSTLILYTKSYARRLKQEKRYCGWAGLNRLIRPQPHPIFVNK
jgi:hypothetical protein